MYHVECIDIHKDDPLFPYVDRACLCANNMYNVSNFYIRNLMTGLKKDERGRTANEAFVIKTVSGSIPGINDSLREKYDRKVRKIRDTEGLSDEERADRIGKVKYLQFQAPTAEKWFASYGLLDAVFKFTDNADYRAFHAHVIQNAVKACCQAWKGYFESLKAFSASSGHTGKPKIPGYKKSGGRTTAVFSNIACSIKHGMLFFPYYTEDSTEGQQQKRKRRRHSLRIEGLPHAAGDKLIEVRIVPYFGICQVQIVTDDGLKEEDLIPDQKDIISAGGEPAGVMMLDPGLNNFAAIADNKGNGPIVVKGGAVKACNQWFPEDLPSAGHGTDEAYLQKTRRLPAGYLLQVRPLYLPPDEGEGPFLSHRRIQQRPETGRRHGAQEQPVLRAGTFCKVPPDPADSLCPVRDLCHPAGGELYLKGLLREQRPDPDIRERRCRGRKLLRKEDKAGSVPAE